MTKKDFLKAAGSVSPHVTAQIEWLENQNYGDHDQAWLSALEVLISERSALWATLERLEKRYEALEADERKQFAAFSAMDNARQTARDERWDMSQIENQIAVYRMATDEDTIREWFENYPND